MNKKSLFKTMVSTVVKIPWFKEAAFIKGVASKNKVGVVDIALFSALSNKEFEQLIQKLFVWRGYSIVEENENNIDLTLKQDNQITFVQFYQWQQNNIEVATIEYLISAMESYAARHGVIISTGEFTEEAIEFAIAKKILLINGNDLSQMVEALMLSEAGTEEHEKLHEPVEENNEADDTAEIEILCPICSNKMIKRVAKKGKSAGNTFWGCSKFPSCRGVISGRENK